MPEGRHVVLACDESGAKGYADQDEAFPGEVGVFAGILIPQQEREEKARLVFQALCDRYRPASGKLHIADLAPEQQEALRADVFAAIKELDVPCFWYAIHVAGLHDWHKTQRAAIAEAKSRKEAARTSPPRIKGNSPRENPSSMHVELFAGLYGHLVAFLLERDCTATDIEIRTDQIDSPIVKEFEEVANRLLNDDPVLKNVKGWDTVTKKVVEVGTVEVRLNIPDSLAVTPTVRSLSINTAAGEDGYVLAADVLANSLNYMFKNRPQEELYSPLNGPEAIAGHPIADSLAAFHDWGTGDLVGDGLYQHPKSPAKTQP
jgi:hypothetical protein